MAAKRGNVAAMAALGRMYDQGQGVKPDRDLATQWYRKAAAAGNPEAKAWLAQNAVDGQAPERQGDR